MEIVKVKDLKFYKNNPRKNDGAVGVVAESISQCGYIAPIVIDENNVVLAGHTRLKALRKMEIEEAEVLRVNDLTEEQKRKYRVLDNKAGEFAAWDNEKLIDELIKIDLQGFDFGFDKPDGFQEVEAPQEYVHISFTLHEEQKNFITDIISRVKKGEIKETYGNENGNGNGLFEVVRQWAEQKKS